VSRETSGSPANNASGVRKASSGIILQACDGFNQTMEERATAHMTADQSQRVIELGAVVNGMARSLPPTPPTSRNVIANAIRLRACVHAIVAVHATRIDFND